MSPILIDSQKMQQIIILLLVTLVLSFLSGYYLGHQLSLCPDNNRLSIQPAHDLDMQQKQALNDLGIVENKPANNSQENLSTKSSSAKKIASKKQTDKKIAQKKIDKKKTEKKKEKKKSKKEAKKTANKAKSRETVTPATVKKETANRPVNTVQQKIQPSAPSAGNPEGEDIVLANNKRKASQKFSIQVGVFANEENAQKLVNEIKGKDFAAYLEQYVSSKGVLKYNVRFGRFQHREQARVRLDAFKRQFSMPAYIIIN